MSAKTVVLLREQKDYLKNLKILPNPYGMDAGFNPVVFRWDCGTETGSAVLKIYNVAGELVKTLRARLEDPAGIAWDTYVKTGERAGRGIYVCVLETRNSGGYINRKTERLAIAGLEPSF
jgi:hypothetical protein